MIIVKRRSEVIRFSLFVILACLLAYYVVGKYGAWHAARSGSTTKPAAPGLIISGPQAIDLVQKSVADPNSDDFFAETRMELERNRGALRATLKELMDNPNADQTARMQASQQYLAVGTQAALEEQAETLVKARGFADALVVLTDGAAQVVVKGNLGEQQFMQIVDTVSKTTGVKPASVVVIPRPH